MNKKGISAVVANVLIVLLVVASVAIIWAVVRPVIEQAGEGIEAGCFQVQLEPIKCDSAANSVTFKRRAGGGEVVESVQLVVADANGDSSVYSFDEGIDELQTKTVDGTDIDGLEVYSGGTFDVGAIVGGNTCELSGIPVTCS